METYAKNPTLRHIITLPGNAGSTSNMIIEGTIVDCMATALVKLSNIHNLTAVFLERGNALIFFQHTACRGMSKMFSVDCSKNNMNLLEIL